MSSFLEHTLVDLGFLPEDDEFKFVKGGKSKSSAASEFNINTTNKIEALMKRAKIEIEENEDESVLENCDPVAPNSIHGTERSKKGKKRNSSKITNKIKVNETNSIHGTERSIKVKKCNSSKITNKIKVKENKAEKWVDHFVTPNPFIIVENNAEEDLDSMIQIKKMPKHLLKKCKHCNFKKRSCVLDPSSCSALNETCFKCDKKGHFPQSICCKINKKSKKWKKIIMPESKSSKPMSKEYFHLIEDRIDQLEKLERKFE